MFWLEKTWFQISALSFRQTDTHVHSNLGGCVYLKAIPKYSLTGVPLRNYALGTQVIAKNPAESL